MTLYLKHKRPYRLAGTLILAGGLLLAGTGYAVYHSTQTYITQGDARYNVSALVDDGRYLVYTHAHPPYQLLIRATPLPFIDAQSMARLREQPRRIAFPHDPSDRSEALFGRLAASGVCWTCAMAYRASGLSPLGLTHFFLGVVELDGRAYRIDVDLHAAQRDGTGVRDLYVSVQEMTTEAAARLPAAHDGYAAYLAQARLQAVLREQSEREALLPRVRARFAHVLDGAPVAKGSEP